MRIFYFKTERQVAGAYLYEEIWCFLLRFCSPFPFTCKLHVWDVLAGSVNRFFYGLGLGLEGNKTVVVQTPGWVVSVDFVMLGSQMYQ